MSCSALNCRNKWAKGSKVAFYSFPVKNEILCQRWLIAMRRSTWKPVPSSKLCSAHFKASCFRMSNGKKVLVEGCVPSIFNFSHKTRCQSPSKRMSPRKKPVSEVKQEELKAEEDTVNTPSNLTDITLQITSDHDYCPQVTRFTTPAISPTNVKLQIRTDDHNYCPTTLTKLITKPTSASTNVELHISRALSSDHDYCPPDKPSTSTAVTLRIKNDTAAPDHNYHCPRSPTKMVRRLKVSEDKCLILTKKLKVARQKIRRQNAKIISLQKTIAGLAQRLCPILGVDVRKSQPWESSNV